MPKLSTQTEVQASIYNAVLCILFWGAEVLLGNNFTCNHRDFRSLGLVDGPVVYRGIYSKKSEPKGVERNLSSLI